MEQSLFSVQKALRGIEGGTEIIVVDNHSQDDTLEYLVPQFSDIRFIANTENRGFAGANNQALAEAKGQYILFLNPDTILPEDACQICLAFMKNTPNIGAAGVRMIDGGGRFLKESRRGFPTSWVAFCKLTGLTALFPHSRLLAGYYLGHLPEDRNHPATILSGACMWADRKALDQAGAFDERFFMYAEDIDLSYRIEQKGFTNYYISETTILHFKGESTRKDARYTRQFYKAMVQFRRKHFNSVFSKMVNSLLESAAALRVSLSPRGEKDPPADYDQILNEGANQTFKEIIAALEGKYKGKKVLIHAENSGSAVGSPSAEGKGIAIPLAPDRNPGITH